MSKNGMATYQGSADYVNLTHLPTPKTEYTVNFDSLTGGLNLYDPDYRLSNKESPDMENMLWKNGSLCSRYGQSYVSDETNRGTGYTCYEGLFWDNAFFHIGSKIYYGEPGGSMTLTELCDMSTLYTGYVSSRGTFFRYGDDLFYKARGVFVRIHYTTSGFTASDVAASAYVPITVINADWDTGGGDLYQPENRLNSKRTIWYNAGTDAQEEKFSGDGTTKDFAITLADFVYVSDVTVNGAAVGNWTVSNGHIIFYEAPAAGTDNIVLTCQCAVKTYYLPVTPEAVTEVTVDGTVLTTGWTLSGNCITFTTAPPVTQPLSNNTVQITYSATNPGAFDSVMDCPYAIVFGGDQNICIVVGGCTAQPNAFFWNGNNIVMDPTYWPMEHYNLAGDIEEDITGFGKQQGYLMILKSHSVGKGKLSFTTVDVGSSSTQRTYIEIDYTNVNSKTGCDLPWSIQLIENNIVFCNTYQGAHIILDTSAAYENNIVGISTKVNGDNGRVGLLERARNASVVSSFDDDKRYWIIMDGQVFCWDYTLSTYKEPSWFYLTGVSAAALFKDVDALYHLNPAGRVSVFDSSFEDYGEAYERRYQFATQILGGYNRLKTVTSAIFSLRSDTDLDVLVTYKTDYETRDDLTRIVSRNWRLWPRNLLYRNLSVQSFATVARRRPGCRHVRHFAMVLTCAERGYDMPILSAQLLYKYEGRDR